MPERASPESAGVEETQEQRFGPGKRDADAARAALKEPTAPPAPRRGRGRPARSAAPPAPHELPGGGEDPVFWGGQLQTLWNSVAKQRGYAPIPDEAAPKIGAAAALVAEKYGPYTGKYPELVLLFMMTPYLASAVTVELKRSRELEKAKREKAGAEKTDTDGDGTRPRPGTQQEEPKFEGSELDL